MWLKGASPSMQKSAIEEDSDHLVALQPNEEGEQEVYEIEELPKEMKGAENASNPLTQIGHFALRGQLEISESECPRGGTHT